MPLSVRPRSDSGRSRCAGPMTLATPIATASEDSKALDAGNFDRLISFGRSSVQCSATRWSGGRSLSQWPTSSTPTCGRLRQNLAFCSSAARRPIESAIWPTSGNVSTCRTLRTESTHRSSGASRANRHRHQPAQSPIHRSRTAFAAPGSRSALDQRASQPDTRLEPDRLSRSSAAARPRPCDSDPLPVSGHLRPDPVRGRAKAEAYRASQVYPRLLHDLYLTSLDSARGAERRSAEDVSR